MLERRNCWIGEGIIGKRCFLNEGGGEVANVWWLREWLRDRGSGMGRRVVEEMALREKWSDECWSDSWIFKGGWVKLKWVETEVVVRDREDGWEGCCDGLRCENEEMRLDIVWNDCCWRRTVGIGLNTELSIQWNACMKCQMVKAKSYWCLLGGPYLEPYT